MAKKYRQRTEFGERLFMAREKKGMTQAQVAKKLNISQGTLSQAETAGEGSSLVVHFAELFDCDPYWLAMGDGAPYPAARRYSPQAAELARAFDALPERSQAEQELKRSLYTVIQNMLVASSWPAKPYAPEPDAAPSRERSKSR